MNKFLKIRNIQDDWSLLGFILPSWRSWVCWKTALCVNANSLKERNCKSSWNCFFDLAFNYCLRPLVQLCLDSFSRRVPTKSTLAEKSRMSTWLRKMYPSFWLSESFFVCMCDNTDDCCFLLGFCGYLREQSLAEVSFDFWRSECCPGCCKWFEAIDCFLEADDIIGGVSRIVTVLTAFFMPSLNATRMALQRTCIRATLKLMNA